jgi:hypothetical protein
MQADSALGRDNPNLNRTAAFSSELPASVQRKSNNFGQNFGQRHKKGLSVSEKAFKIMELAMGLEPATG